MQKKMKNFFFPILQNWKYVCSWWAPRAVQPFQAPSVYTEKEGLFTRDQGGACCLQESYGFSNLSLLQATVFTLSVVL